VQATTHRRSLASVPVGAVAIFFWLVALAIGLIVVFVAAVVILTLRLTVKITVMVCGNLFRYFPG
jgi:hypothetical protein